MEPGAGALHMRCAELPVGRNTNTPVIFCFSWRLRPSGSSAFEIIRVIPASDPQSASSLPMPKAIWLLQQKIAASVRLSYNSHLGRKLLVSSRTGSGFFG
ncbi:hypothetical protein SCP_0214070 [Sparassis crispa]|uniref:Uncharacterized protein n=1 Tax=Sparassis crispa TaxID=139825 RepID=A0A401GDF3_9APHY|nr:hypothetical protein SCP_0214070 [Sparassis crispa]GBE80197.1 hypothetical protein SCP_0214070 [Sparassis crispa]